MKALNRRATTAFVAPLAFFMSQAFGGEYYVSCHFESTTKPPADPMAAEWNVAQSHLRMDWILGTAPLRIIHGPGAKEKRGDRAEALDDPFWGAPRLVEQGQSIEMTFRPRMRPIERHAEIGVTINRSTGVATKSFSALSRPNAGPMVAYWLQFGTCTIDMKRM